MRPGNHTSFFFDRNLRTSPTAKLRNVEPRAYLIQAAYAAIEHPETIILPDVLRDDSPA